MKKQGKLLSVILTLVVLVLFAVHAFHPLQAGAIENSAQNESVENTVSENEDDEESGLLLSSCTLEDAFEETTFIYLDAENGDDECLGVTVENAVKTFDRAKELTSINDKIITIHVVRTTVTE